MRVLFFQPSEKQAEQIPDAHRENEEACRLEQCQPDVALTAYSGDKAERYNSDNVVYYRGAEDCGADLCVQLSQLAHGLDRYADACRGKDTADKQRVHQLRVIAEAVHEYQRAEGAESHRDKNPSKGNRGCGGTALLQLPEIRLKPA